MANFKPSSSLISILLLQIRLVISFSYYSIYGKTIWLNANILRFIIYCTASAIENKAILRCQTKLFLNVQTVESFINELISELKNRFKTNQNS